MNPLAINTLGDELEKAAVFCRTEKVGIEITDFAFPDILDSDLGPVIDRHIKALDGIAPVISHGPLFDLATASRDPRILEVCRLRHWTALEASHKVGATVFVAHTQYNPMINHPTYEGAFVGRTVEFWLPFADWAGNHGVTICLENLWEPTPELQYNIMSEADHPHLRATFDNGHPLVFSKMTGVEWVERLAPYLGHCHLHDNHGKSDEHLAVGEGIENWPALMSAYAEYAPEVPLVMESDKLETNTRSLHKVREVRRSL